METVFSMSKRKPRCRNSWLRDELSVRLTEAEARGPAREQAWVKVAGKAWVKVADKVWDKVSGKEASDAEPEPKPKPEPKPEAEDSPAAAMQLDRAANKLAQTKIPSCICFRQSTFSPVAH